MKNENKTQKFILKFFPEIMIKGSSAKRQMINQLHMNLKNILGKISEDIALRKFFDKIEIVTPIEHINEVRVKLVQTPGIEQILEALQFDNMNSLEDIKEAVNKVVSSQIQNKSFVLRAKRSGNHDFKSPELERAVGGYILSRNKTSKVDLHNPDITLNIELLNNQLNIISSKYKGLSGFPIGTQGDILSLMSGGFDSTVASYLTIKRGIKTHFIFFNLGGLAHEIGVKQVALHLCNNFQSSHRIKFISIPFDDVLEEIFRSTPESYMGVTLKRLMLKASQQVAKDMEIDALLTGESVAQVSSQTLRNLALIDEACDMLVIRPLATMNKPEIIDLAAKIGTKRFAENMPEYCGVISKNPIVHGSHKRMQLEAKKFNYDVLDTAVKNAVSINVDEIVDDIKNIATTPTVSDISNKDYTIIDIRNEEECINTVCETIKIPFFKLKNEFPKLDQNKEYLLYCDKGIMSQLHAQYLIDTHNYKNLKVYRP